MTVSITPTGVVYNVTVPVPGTEYELPFPYIEVQDVKAYYRLGDTDTALNYGSDYTVADQKFVSVSVFPVGAVLAIYRETQITQEILWVDGQAIYAPDIMQADDKLTFIAQEILNDVSRAVKVPRDDPGQTPEEIIAEVFAARDVAQANAASANQSAVSAAGSRDAAASSAAEASSSATAAAGHETMAQKWAENPEDVAVIPDHYSALHWARKAQEVAAGDLAEASPICKGLAPTGGTANQFYKATADGTAYAFEDFPVDGKTLDFNDEGKLEAKGGGIPMFAVIPFPLSTTQPGYLSVCMDNGVLTAESFPQAVAQLAALKAAGETNIVSLDAYAAEMSAQEGICGRFALSDDGTQFRIPCMPGAYWRAMGAGGGLNVGDWQPDQMRPIDGEYGASTNVMLGQGAFHGMPSTGDNTTGAFTQGRTTTYSAGTYTGSGSKTLVLDTRLLGDNFNGDDTHPLSVVGNYQMKLYGAVTEASEANIAALIAATAGKLDTARHVAEYGPMPFKNVWISEEQPINNVSPYITQVTHGLNLQDPMKVLGDVRLVCKVSEYGYAVGETAAFMSYMASAANMTPMVNLYADYLTYQAGYGGTGNHHIMDKTSGAMVTATASRWQLVFRVFY